MNTLARVPLAVLLLLICVRPAIGQERTEIAQETARVRLLLDRGAYAEAERDARQLMATISAHDPHSLDEARASDLLVEALVGTGQAAASDTLALAEQAVRLKEQRLGRDHLETASSLQNLATVRLERGELGTVVLLDRRALAIRVRQLPPNAAAIADSLDHLAAPLMRIERFEEAQRVLTRALSIREMRSDTEPLALAHTLELAGWRDRFAGDYASGQKRLARVLAIRERLSPDHPDMISVIELRGDLLMITQDIDSAVGAWTAGLSMVERTLGPEHPAAVGLQRRLAYAQDALGNRLEARRLLADGVRIAERSLAPCNSEMLGLQTYRASALKYDGQYTEARTLYRRALHALEQCVGPGHSRTATVIYNLALLASTMGDFAEAERLHARAIRLWSAALGPTHPYVARGWDALAEVAAWRGHRARAQDLYARALALRRHALGARHPEVAWTLANLARVRVESGDLARAERDVAQAIAIVRDVGPSNEPDHLARVLALRGEIESRRGDYRAARASFAEALSLRERKFGGSHPLAAEARAEVAAADFALGAREAALGEALEAEQAGRDHLRFTMRYLPERQAMAYAGRRVHALDLALSIEPSGEPSGPGRTFDALIHSRGIILDELAARAAADDDADPQAAPLTAAAVHARQRFADLVVGSLQGSVSRALLDGARQRKEDAEQALAERSAPARAELTRARIGLDDVRGALPVDATLVSFVKYDRTSSPADDQPAGGRAAWHRAVSSYAAFVQRSGARDTIFVPLGTAASLEPLIKTWHDEAAGRSIAAGASRPRAERLYRAAASRLRQAIWDPLAPALSGVARVFVVPDGLLNIVNIAALPDAAGRYLVESGPTIHYVSTERDLVAAPSVGPERHSLLAVGGPAFGAPDVAAASKIGPKLASSTVSRGSGCQDFSRLRFADLPGSRGEVAEIARAWPAHDPSDVAVLSGRAATETAVKRAINGHRVVHLATHGFFLGSDCPSGLEGLRGVGGLAPEASTPHPTLGENPLLMAGLALAGANHRGPLHAAQDDGILTAEEIAGLDLRGTEWAVLSACDTGLGEIKAGEGVFGLRRAFQIAGARTVIMSLWAVEDDTARVWMRALYEGRFNAGLTTADAVREASLTVLHARRSQGVTTHPFFWAGFVAAGDWK